MKDLKTTLLIILCIIVLFLCFYFPNKIAEMRHTQGSLYELTANTQQKEEFYYLNFDLNNQMTGLIAPSISCIKSNKSEYLLSELVNEKPLLIYRYTNAGCSPCYIAELKLFHKVFSDNYDLARVFCSYQTELEFVTSKKINKIKFPYYRITLEAFDWKLEEYNSSYYFVLHPDMKISHIYVPNKEYPELSIQYLEGVKRFLSE